MRIICWLNIKHLKIAELVKKFRNYLTDLEFEELKVYKEVWYFGQHASKNYNKPAPTANTTNLGYDDDNGNYKIVRFRIIYMGKPLFTVLLCRSNTTT